MNLETSKYVSDYIPPKVGCKFIVIRISSFRLLVELTNLVHIPMRVLDVVNM